MPTRRFCVLLAAALFCLVLAAPLPAAPLPAAPDDVPRSVPDYARDRDALIRALPDATVETLADGFVVVTPAPFTPLAPAWDARYKWRFSRAISVYVPRKTGAAAGLFRVATVHHEPDNLEIAQQTARLCARLLRLHRAHFGRETQFPFGAETMDLWLAPEHPQGQSDAGGETRQNQVYVFAVGASDSPRTPLEWTRTLAHEWGHLTLPGARGYVSPENDAGGYLGERLYMKWLREEGQNGAKADDGVTRADLDTYYERQIAPLLERWQTQGGPFARILNGADTEAMDYYIAAVLSCDDSLGSPMTGRALFRVTGTRAHDFLNAVARTTEVSSPFSVRLPACVPLPRGRFAVSTTGNGSAAISGAKSPLALRGYTDTMITLATPGWRWLRAQSGSVSSLTLRRVAP